MIEGRFDQLPNLGIVLPNGRKIHIGQPHDVLDHPIGDQIKAAVEVTVDHDRVVFYIVCGLGHPGSYLSVPAGQHYGPMTVKIGIIHQAQAIRSKILYYDGNGPKTQKILLTHLNWKLCVSYGCAVHVRFSSTDVHFCTVG